MTSFTWEKEWSESCLISDTAWYSLLSFIAASYKSSSPPIDKLWHHRLQHSFSSKERRRQDLCLGGERNYEFDPTCAKSRRLLACERFWAEWSWEYSNDGLLVFRHVFSLEMSKEWRNLGKKTTMRSGSQISPPTGHLPRNGNLGEALAQLLEKTNEAQWPWQKWKGSACKVMETWRWWKAMLGYERRWFNNTIMSNIYIRLCNKTQFLHYTKIKFLSRWFQRFSLSYLCGIWDGSVVFMQLNCRGKLRKWYGKTTRRAHHELSGSCRRGCWHIYIYIYIYIERCILSYRFRI